jgi:hypothetical protein
VATVVTGIVEAATVVAGIAVVAGVMDAAAGGTTGAAAAGGTTGADGAMEGVVAGKSRSMNESHFRIMRPTSYFCGTF